MTLIALIIYNCSLERGMFGFDCFCELKYCEKIEDYPRCSTKLNKAVIQVYKLVSVLVGHGL